MIVINRMNLIRENICTCQLQKIAKHFYDINSLAPIDLFIFKFILIYQMNMSFLCAVRIFFKQVISFPQSRETRGIAGGITHCMSNIAMTQIILN